MKQFPDGIDTVLWFPFLPFTLAQNAKVTLTAAPQVPDGWLIAVAPGATTRVDVFLSTDIGGGALRIGGGGFARVPANGSDSITFVGVGATPAVVSLVAVRGPAIKWAMIDAGELA